MTEYPAKPFSPADLADDLRRLGLKAGDTIMLHASLRAIGPVEDGADGVLDAVEMALGDQGTLLMILGAVVEHEWINQRPEAERAALLAAVAPYDPNTAPALPEVGALAEVFRSRPGTMVSDNPSGRFAAWGRAAEALLADAPWDDYYGPDSPLDRLCRMVGRVLRLGANPDTTTVLHYAEYVAEVPNKRRIRRHYRVMGPDGPVTRSVGCLDDEHGIVDWPGEDYFAVILNAYRTTGRVKAGTVGRAPSELIEAQDLVDFGARWMSEHLPAAANARWLQKLSEDHLSLGAKRCVSYLPIPMIETVLRTTIAEIVHEAETRNLGTLTVDEERSPIRGGAVHFYSEPHLAGLLERHKDTLDRSQWPSNSRDFMRRVSREWVSEDHPVKPIIREAFGDVAGR